MEEEGTVDEHDGVRMQVLEDVDSTAGSCPPVNQHLVKARHLHFIAELHSESSTAERSSTAAAVPAQCKSDAHAQKGCKSAQLHVGRRGCCLETIHSQNVFLELLKCAFDCCLHHAWILPRQS